MDSKLEKALGRILLVFPVLGYITSKWELKEGEVATMATDYTHLFYNKAFLDSLTPEEVGGVVLHEIGHCLLLHPTEITKIQGEGKDPELWQIALEIVTNATVQDLIQSAGNSGSMFKIPGQPYSPLKGGEPPYGPFYFYDPAGHTHTATEIYDLLIKKIAPRRCPDTGSGGGTGKKGQSLEKTDGSGTSTGGKNIILSGDILPAGRTESQDAAEVTIAVLQKLSSLTKGSLPLGLDRLLKRLTEGKVPWERILHSWVGAVVSGSDDFRWERPNHRHPLSDKVIIPGLVDNEVENIIVVVDTSGSISDRQLSRFASEIAKLSQYVGEITVITTDAEVHEKVKVSSASNLLKKLKFKGGGGTDFRPVFESVKNCLGMIFFTDACATYPERKPEYPVLWILTKDHSTPPFGKVAFILDE
jgi:predicted metal-dependent peptidase